MEINISATFLYLMPLILIIGFVIFFTLIYYNTRKLKWLLCSFVTASLLILFYPFMGNPFGTSVFNSICINTGTHRYSFIDHGIVHEKINHTPLSEFMIENILTNGYEYSWQFTRGYTPYARCALGKYRHVGTTAMSDDTKLFLEAIRNFHPEKLSYWLTNVFHPDASFWIPYITYSLSEHPEALLNKNSFDTWLKEPLQLFNIEMLDDIREQSNKKLQQTAADE